MSIVRKLSSMLSYPRRLGFGTKRRTEMYLASGSRTKVAAYPTAIAYEELGAYFGQLK